MDVSNSTLDEMFRPPVLRTAAAALDRALFTKTVPLAAARVADRGSISRIRSLLESNKQLLRTEKIPSVVSDPDSAIAAKGGRCLLLDPAVSPRDTTTWSDVLREAAEAKEVEVISYDLKLSYDYWNYLEIMKAILPEDAQEEIPVGFSIVGHVAHLNLRSEYLPFKTVIAQVLMDKNPTVRTVINKVDDVGNASEYRTFGYEVLAGADDMNVEIKEEDCVFRFDYSKVYWNSRLNTEHRRLVSLFKPGEVVCDVMAGVGPFAVPAGKKGVFVWANDLNPDSYASLSDAIVRNRVQHFVRPFCVDGHTFPASAASSLLFLARSGRNTVTLPIKPTRHRAIPPGTVPPPAPKPKTLIIPPTISHFVMNLPATAISFLPSYNGLYAGEEGLFAPNTTTKLPLIHVHCFSTKSEDNVKEGIEIAARISHELGVELVPEAPVQSLLGKVEALALGKKKEKKEEVFRDFEDMKDGEVRVYDVRDVAPLKRMFCASFRLPTSVAFKKKV